MALGNPIAGVTYTKGTCSLTITWNEAEGIVGFNGTVQRISDNPNLPLPHAQIDHVDRADLTDTEKAALVGLKDALNALIDRKGF